MMPVFVDCIHRTVRKECNAVRRAAVRHDGDVEAFGKWADKFYAEHCPLIDETLAAPMMPLFDLLGESNLQIAVALRKAASTRWCSDASSEVKLRFKSSGMSDWIEQRPMCFPSEAAVELMEALLETGEQRDQGVECRAITRTD